MKKPRVPEYAKPSVEGDTAAAQGSSPDASHRGKPRAARRPRAGRKTPGTRGGRLSADWLRFETRLAEHLPALGADQTLVLSVAGAPRYVQVTAQGSWGMRLEAVSNGYLAPHELLTESAEVALRALGWSPPTHLPMDDVMDVDGAGPDASLLADAFEGEGDDGPFDGDANEAMDAADFADGSPYWFLDVVAPVATDAIARLIVRTFTRVYRVRHPSLLQYYAFASDGPTILLPGLGITAEMPPVQPPHEDVPLPARVAAACHATADDEMRRGDGWHRLTVDGVPLRVVIDDAHEVVRLSSRVMPVDEAGGDVFETVNRLNARWVAYGYLAVRDGDVCWATEVPTTACSSAAVVAALVAGAASVRRVVELLRVRT